MWAQVHERQLPVPRYSYESNAARFDENGNFLEAYQYSDIQNIPDHIKLLQRIYDKYMRLREEAIQKLKQQRQQYDQEPDYEAGLEPEYEAAPRRR